MSEKRNCTDTLSSTSSDKKMRWKKKGVKKGYMPTFLYLYGNNRIKSLKGND